MTTERNDKLKKMRWRKRGRRGKDSEGLKAESAIDRYRLVPLYQRR